MCVEAHFFNIYLIEQIFLPSVWRCPFWFTISTAPSLLHQENKQIRGEIKRNAEAKEKKKFRDTS